MELSIFEQADQITIELTSPKTGLPTGMFVDIVGTESEEYIAAQEANINARLKRGKTEAKYEAERVKFEQINICVAVVKGWRGFNDKGEEIVFSKTASKAIAEKYPSFRDQITTALTDQSLFFSE